MNAHLDSGGRHPTAESSRAFLLQAALWNVFLFGLIRLPWFDRHVIGRLVEFQKSVVFWYSSGPHPNLVVNSSCSGADVMALCAGVLLAYPAAWRRRVAGAVIGMGLLLALNAVRIASLYALASTPATFRTFHLYVWPAVLALAAIAYVVAWIRWASPQTEGSKGTWSRLCLGAVVALLAYAAVAPWVLTSPGVLRIGAWTATAAASVLGGLGADVQTSGAVLVTARGAFAVTQECLFTPTIPLYLAAAWSLPLSRRSRVTWFALALPVFFMLGVARVLVLALPPEVVGSPLPLVHGFYQLVAGAVLVIAAAHLGAQRASGRGPWRRSLASIGLATVACLVAVKLWEPGLLWAAKALQGLLPTTLASLTPAGDNQGALALFPVFQVGLLAGLWLALTGGRRVGQLVGVLSVLACLQLAFLCAIGSASAWYALTPHALLVRAWAIGVPVVLAAVWAVPARGTPIGDKSYLRFWHDVGEDFPSLTGAASTSYYFESETRLLLEALPSLSGCRILKTDLWDEAKNTRIMQWAADQGARVYGIDVSAPMVREARTAFGTRSLLPVVSDVRRMPFGDAIFDAIYSMGTIEHFEGTEAAVIELARVLKPGGRLILGLPNRWHPFLRPLLVASLNRLGLYAYGFEKSYSRRALRRMIEAAGLAVRTETGILFMPGSLRMLDLLCHTRMRPLARLTGALVQPFAWLDRHLPALRRHGYLLATVAEKPGAPDAAGLAGA